MSATQDGIDYFFSSFVDDMIDDIDYSSVSTPEDQDEILLRIKDEGLIVQEDISTCFSILLNKKPWIWFFKGCFSWNFTG